MRKLLIPAMVLALAACSDGGAGRRAYLNSLVGQPDTELVRSLGVPTRTYDAGGRRFVAYDDRRLNIDYGPFIGAGFGFGYGLGGFGYPNGFYGGAFPPTVYESGCETTFEIDGGVVRSWSLRGNACG